jgi:hypothetical protein
MSILFSVVSLISALPVFVVAQTADDPSQLGTRQIEVRTLDVSYELAYRAATQAMFSLEQSLDLCLTLDG